MKVDRSRLYVPALMKQGVSEGQKEPMLVTALQVNDTTTVDSVVVDSAAAGRNGEEIPGLTGRLRIEIPKATWLRGPRRNVELSGRLDIVLDSASTRLSGYLVVEEPYLRGRFRLGEIQLYVNRGVGNSGLDVRLSADPEVTLAVVRTPEAATVARP